MPIEKIQIKKMKGLCLYITQLDHHRPPTPFGITPYSISTFLELSLSRNKPYFIKNDQDLYKKAKEEVNHFYNGMVEYTPKRFVKLITFSFIILTLVSLAGFIIFYLYCKFNLISTLLLTFSTIFLPIFYLGLIWELTNQRRAAGGKYGANIKKAVQLLIDHGTGKIQKGGLNPDDFPIKLRHDDYYGLEYELKGENSFIGVLRN